MMTYNIIEMTNIRKTDSFYEMLKSSPLCKSLDVAPEESAMWLESHMLGNAAGIKKAISRALLRMHDISYDYIDGPWPSMSFNGNVVLYFDEPPRASKMIFKSVFEALFIAGMLDTKPKELEKVLKWAKRKQSSLKNELAKAKDGKRSMHSSCAPATDILCRLEVVAELVERLEKKLHCIVEKDKAIHGDRH